MKTKVFCEFCVIVTLYCIIIWAFVRAEVKEIYIPMIILGVAVLLLLTVVPLIMMIVKKDKKD